MLWFYDVTIGLINIKKLLLIMMMLTFHQEKSFGLNNTSKFVSRMTLGQRFDLRQKKINPLDICPTFLFLLARQTSTQQIAANFESTPAFYNTDIRLHSVGINGRFLANHRMFGIYGFFDFSIQENLISLTRLLNFCSINVGFESLVKDHQVHCNLYVPLRAYDHCIYDYMACKRGYTLKDFTLREANYLESGNLGADVNVQHKFRSYPATVNLGSYLFYDRFNNQAFDSTTSGPRWIIGGTLKLMWQWSDTWLVYTQISLDNAKRSSSIALGIQSQFSTPSLSRSIWKASIVRHVSPLFAPEYTNVSKQVVNRDLLNRQCQQYFQGNELVAIQEVAAIMDHCNTSIPCLIAEKNKDNYLTKLVEWSDDMDIAQLSDFIPRKMHLAIHPDKKNFVTAHTTRLTTQQRRNNFLMVWPEVLKLSLQQNRQIELTADSQ